MIETIEKMMKGTEPDPVLTKKTKEQVRAVIPTPWGNFQMVAYSDTEKELMPHFAMVHENFQPIGTTTVRIHSECITGDLFGSKRCDCGEQLHQAMQLAAESNGIVLYMRQEGRGIGIINKLKAYNLQDDGLNTVEANLHLGLEADGRQYETAIQMLAKLGVRKIKLITNNPLKVDAFENSPIKVVERIPIIIPPKEENKDYLKTKQKEMGHLFDLE